MQSISRFPTITGDIASAAELGAALKKVDAVVSCLPYHLNRDVAVAAHEAGIHYFDLTEDVPTTKATLELSKTSKGLMAPQCGLAPGFIGIAGSHLTNAFSELRTLTFAWVLYPRTRPDSLDMHSTGPQRAL